MDLGQMIHGLSEVFPWEWQAVIIRHQAQTLGMKSYRSISPANRHFNEKATNCIKL
jgi:hypothetical protein